MRSLFIFLILLIISGCMETPDLSSSKEKVAKDQIKSNQTEAEKAQNEYLSLQKQRNIE